MVKKLVKNYDKCLAIKRLVVFYDTSLLGRGNQDLSEMLEECNGIIHAAVVGCDAGGIVWTQIPVPDNVIIAPILVQMIVRLGAVFESYINIRESDAKIILARHAIAEMTDSQILVVWIPTVANAVNIEKTVGLKETIG